MQFNQYIWNNYKETQAGKNILDLFRNPNRDSLNELAKKFVADASEETGDYLFELLEEYQDKTKLIDDFEKAEAYFISLIENGIEEADEVIFGENDYRNSFYNLDLISLWLYCACPNYFKPYFFLKKFFELTKIADTFSIEIPTVPIKKDKYTRLKYYLEICKVFNQFQEGNNLTPEEVCAFFYDYAPNFIGKEMLSNTNLPEPTQIWLVGGNQNNNGDIDFLDNATNESNPFWQGNIDTKRGDIVIMYCLSPRSSIHSVWRATVDGFADPFFYYYSCIYIGAPIKVTPIHITELKSDAYFSQNPLVRKNLQGINGYNFSSKDYEHLLEMLAAKGFDVSQLPKLYKPTIELDVELKTERDVEINLVEPFISNLGYNKEDWMRQLPVRMGRGERNYPDYVFFPVAEKGYEKGKMLIETKYLIKSNLELEETFKQARSYAVRLESQILILCDKEAIWLYEKVNGNFDRAVYTKKFWGEISNEDTFQLLKLKIGKDRLIKIK